MWTHPKEGQITISLIQLRENAGKSSPMFLKDAKKKISKKECHIIDVFLESC